MQFILSHVVSLIGVTSIVSAAAAWIIKSGPGFAEKEVAALDGELFARIKNPAVKTVLIEIEQAVSKAVPDAGNDKYSVLTDMIMKELPLTATPARPVILAVLTAIGAGAKAGIADAASSASGPIAHS